MRNALRLIASTLIPFALGGCASRESPMLESPAAQEGAPTPFSDLNSTDDLVIELDSRLGEINVPHHFSTWESARERLEAELRERLEAELRERLEVEINMPHLFSPGEFVRQRLREQISRKIREQLEVALREQISSKLFEDLTKD